jgi:hypothetical protein
MKEVKDQIAHIVVAIAALFPVAFFPHPLTGLFGGIVIGFLAELKEESSKITIASFKAVLRSRRSRLDICGYGVGGVIVGFIA